MTTEQVSTGELAAILRERDLRYGERFESQQEALRIYEEHAVVWRHAANEWRAAMSDREKAFITRSEHNLLLERVSKTETMVHQHLSSGQGQKDMWGWMVAGVVALMSMWSHFK